MSDHDLTREFKKKCSVSGNQYSNDNNNNGNNDANQSQSCSFCVKSPPKNAYYCVHIVKGARSSCLYAKSSTSRENLLQGAMILRGDGVVEGEIKGEVYSRGEEELVRGECGLEVISDDDEDVGRRYESKQSKADEVRPKPHPVDTSSRGSIEKTPFTPTNAVGGEEEVTHRPRKYLFDHRSINPKKHSNGGQTSQKSKSGQKESSPRPAAHTHLPHPRTPPPPPRAMSWPVPVSPFPCPPPMGHQRPYARHPHPFHPFHPHHRSPRAQPRFPMTDVIRPLNAEGPYRDNIENSTLTP